MKTKTVTVREGEYLGPVDWSFDFEEFLDDYVPACCNGQQRHDEAVAMAIRNLAILADAKEAGCLSDFRATNDGGYPRMWWKDVLEVGMYDGWPYWEPVPSVCLSGTLGGEWHSMQSITDVRCKGNK